MDAVGVLESLDLLGINHWGLVTAAQARDSGISRLWLQRLNERGILQRLRHGVYALPSSQPGFLQDVQGAWLSVASAANSGKQSPTAPSWPAVVSGATATAVHELGDLVPPYIELSVPVRRTSKQHDLRLVERTLENEDVVVIDGLPVTTVEQTIHDLSSASTDLDHLANLVADAARRPNASVTALANTLEARAMIEGETNGLNFLEQLLSTQGLSIELVARNGDVDTQPVPLLAALMNPQLGESLRASVLKELENLEKSTSGLDAVGRYLAQVELPDISTLVAHIGKAVLSLRETTDDPDHQNDDQK